MLTVKIAENNDLLVSGYGVIFDSVDDRGDWFTAETEFYPQFWPNPLPVWWSHEKDKVLGFVESHKKNEFGLHVNMRLNSLTGNMRTMILDSAEAGELGMSSGSHKTLVERENGVGSRVTQWIMREISLTTNPAESATKRNSDALKTRPFFDENLRGILLAIETEKALTMLESPSTRAAGELLLTIAELEQESFAAKKSERIAIESQIAKLELLRG